MKTNKIFALAAFAATALFAASCSSEEPANPGDKIGPGDPAQISIQLTSPVSPTSRAEADYGFDYDAEDDDKVINDFIIFVTRTDGSFDIAPKYYAGSERPANGQITVTATNSATGIYVVANTGPLAGGAFANVSNLTQLRAVTMKMDANPLGDAYDLKAGNVWMGGHDATLTNDPAAPQGTVRMLAEVNLRYVAAKVFVITKSQMTGTANNTSLTGVAMINAGMYTGFVNSGTDDSPVFAPTMTGVTAPFYNNGVAIPAVAVDVPYTDFPAERAGTADYTVNAAAFANQVGFAELTNEPYTGATTLASSTENELQNANAFYVCPVAAATEKTWATVYGKFNANGLETPDKVAAAADAYWSVAWDGADNTIADALEASHKYIVSIALRGDKGSGSGKQDDPTIETLSQDLLVTINQAQWYPVSAEKVYQ